MTLDHRLATYGSLAPGRVNYHQVSDLGGDWQAGVVRGRLINAGWASGLGYPALVLDPDGPPVEVLMLISAALPEHSDRLDAFEGAEYLRVVAPVETATGMVEAWIYVSA